MRVLICWGSKMGGTRGIARSLGDDLVSAGIEVELVPAREVTDLARYDAVIIGGGLYANRWHRDARNFALRHTDELRRVPVWLFSSGPLDDSANLGTIPPTAQVKALMERVGAVGHMTFGGRLPADANGIITRAIASKRSGDWRSAAQVHDWAQKLAGELPTARPGTAVDHPERSLVRLFAHGIAGWAGCAAIMGGLLAITSAGVAAAVHAIAAPLVFALVSRHYFAPPGARQPLTVALAFTGIALALDLVVVAGLIMGSLSMFSSVVGTWLPLALVFVCTYLVGFISSTLPWPKGEDAPRHSQPTHAHGGMR